MHSPSWVEVGWIRRFFFFEFFSGPEEGRGARVVGDPGGWVDGWMDVLGEGRKLERV